MTDKQLSFKEEKITEILNEVTTLLKEDNYEEVIGLLERGLKIDFEYPGIASSLKAVNFWRDRFEKYRNMKGYLQRGEYLFKQWVNYKYFSFTMRDIPDSIDFSIKNKVFNLALDDFLKSIDATNRYDTHLLLQIGRSYKAIGDYENAIASLEEANSLENNNSEILSELADCYSLIEEEKASKIFFREAFFLNPENISILTLETPSIKKIILQIYELGYPLEEIPPWIPVYATLWGVFNIKRELKPLELGKLKQSIYTLEHKIEEGNEDPYLVPKLLNRYFWLIDHYVTSNEEQSKIDEILEKIKNLNPTIFKEYTN